MDQLLRLKRPAGVRSPLVLYDPEQERIMRSLQPPSEICAEENRNRVANRRFSDVFPLRRATAEGQVNSHLSEHNNIVNRDVAHYNHADLTSLRIASAPLLGKVGHYLTNTSTTNSPHSLGRQSTLDQVNSSTICPSPNTPSDSRIATPPTSQHFTINTTVGGDTFVMTGAHIPPRYPKSHPCLPLALYPSGSNPAAPSYVSREDSDSSLVSLGARDTSIRIVKPNLTLSPPQKLKDKDSKKDAIGHSTSSLAGKSKTIMMRGSNQNDEKGHSNGEGSRSRSKTINEHSRSHSRSLSQHKQSSDAPQGCGGSGGHSAGPLMAKPDPSTRNGGIVRSESTDRGRTMQRRYEFIDSDDKAHTVLSPVQETGKKGNDKGDGEGIVNVGRESNMTTMTDLLRRCAEISPPKLPTRQNRRQQQINGDIGTSATQPSLPQPMIKRRPPPLNLKDPVYLGRVRHTDRYEIEHVAIKSSKAELFDWCGPKTSSPIYDDRVKNPPRIPPLDIPSLNELRGVDALQLYDEWRKNLKPVRTASQSSIHIAAPNWEEGTCLNGKRIDQDRLPILNYPIAQDTPIVNHVRSRSTLGIREDRDREQRHRQFSSDSAYTASEYSATPLGQGPGITRSVTMHDVPHRDCQSSNGSGSKASRYGATLNDVPVGVETEMLSPPFTPLTPFIMKAAGAPAGVERGSKTLFGEHGWLEDTAASGMTKPKIEKVGGFMESLKRKAREIADNTSFKPTRNIRAGAVNRINISLDAREQSLLYCELEYNLNNALDAYVKAQLNSGRLEASKLSRIAEAWAQKGRPKVVSFRYDLETQVDLITAHIDNFRFYGPIQAEGPAAVTGLLYAMKTNARYMRIRTFCQPDSVIAKHVLDAQNFLRLLGSPESLQRPLEEVAQFFKVAVDRHKAMAEAPAGRYGSDRIVSKASGRVISNGSEQRVRFQDEDKERPRHYAEMPAASKSSTDVRDPNYGTTASQLVKPQGERRGLHQQRPQFSDDVEVAKTCSTGQGRSYSRHH
ncbi:hypothetical protein F5B21DRAFT_523069 [Xylaria acuta]|nr:hypothetical protein F5B21DRAFT_523069 [Xylaria acuta]